MPGTPLRSPSLQTARIHAGRIASYLGRTLLDGQSPAEARRADVALQDLTPKRSLLKDAPAEKLVEAVRVVAGGDALLAPRVARRVVEHFISHPGPRPEATQRLEDLTARELEVLRLVARGQSNAEIARELVISEHTAKTHVGHVLTKLRLRDRIQAVVFAYESGVVRAGEANDGTTVPR